MRAAPLQSDLIRLQVGARYLTRDGRATSPVEFVQNWTSYRFAVYVGDDKSPTLLALNGRYWKAERWEHPSDIVGEIYADTYC